VTEVREAKSRIVELLREPYRMGFFGTLSIGFLVSILVTVLGFLIFTFYSVRGRLVAFGALRANGLSVFQLAAVVALEQLANLGLGLGVGVGLGRLCTRLFLPFLRDRAGSLGEVPPFLVVWNLGDLRGILLAMAGLFVAAVLGLSLYLARTRLFQALKMGGDA
jgi:putative ABC transport system permease protein